MTRIVVHIDRLVLRGVDRADAAAVTAAIHTELERLLARPGAAQGLAGTAGRSRVRTAPVRLGHGHSANVLGRAAAGRIVQGLRP